jgi:hypothetical protein
LEDTTVAEPGAYHVVEGVILVNPKGGGKLEKVLA